MFLRSMSPVTHVTDRVDTSHLTEHNEIHYSPRHVKIKGNCACANVLSSSGQSTTSHITT